MRKYKYKKNYRTKKKRALLKNKFFWQGFLILFILGNLIYLFIFSPVFQLKEIRVSGVQKTPLEEIRQIILGNIKNIFLANLKNMSRILLEKYPQIASVNMKRKLPDKILVEVEERKPVAVLCNGECFFIDNQAIVFEKVSEVPSGMIIIKAQNISQKQLNQILKINSELTLPFEEILIVSERRFNLKTSEGWEVYLNPEENLDWQLEELDIILKEKIPPEERGELEYIDLRFDKVFIYPEI